MVENSPVANSESGFPLETDFLANANVFLRAYSILKPFCG